MAAIYDSNKPLIFLDLNHLSEDLSVIGDREIHFDTTIILNELLHLVCIVTGKQIGRAHV